MAGGRELFREGEAELYLLHEERSVLMQRGDFVVQLVTHVSCRLAAAVAMVGDMQWPLGKDLRVGRLGSSSFYFSNLPAQLRFVVSLDNLTAAGTRKLESLLQEYAVYVELSHPMRPIDHEVNTQTAVKYWPILARNFDANTAGSDVGEETHSGSDEWPRTDSKCKQQLADRMQQALRMSAVVKLLVRSLDRGAIHPSKHVEKDWRSEDELMSGLMLASVDAVAKVMAAVETAGKTLVKTDSRQTAETSGRVDNLTHAQSSYIGHPFHGRDVREQKAFAEEDEVFGSRNNVSASWTLNNVGMRMLFATIVARMNRSGCSDGFNSTSPRSSQQQQSMSVNSKSACAHAVAACGRSTSSIASDSRSHVSSVEASSQAESDHHGGQPVSESDPMASLEGGVTLPAWMRAAYISRNPHAGAVGSEPRESNQCSPSAKPPRVSAGAAHPRPFRPAPLPVGFYGPSTASFGYGAGPVASTPPVVIPAAAVRGSSVGPPPPPPGFRVLRPHPVPPPPTMHHRSMHPPPHPPHPPSYPPHPPPPRPRPRPHGDSRHI